MSLDSPKKPMTRPDHEDAFAHEQEGLHKGLGARQLQMIAIGSAIGTGLFLGTGGRLEKAGPMLAIIFAVCADPAPPLLWLVRLIHPRILRRKGGVRLRLAVLAQLGYDGGGGCDRNCYLHLLVWAI